MIITCEACTKRYVIDAKAVGDSGRTVRCVACGHSWAITPAKESVIDLFPENEEDLHPVPQKKKRSGPSLWVWMSILVFALGCGVIIGREHVTNLWPGAAPYYKQMGLPIESPGTGLVLQHISVIPVEENGQRALIVKGAIANPTSEVKYLPALKVKAYGSCEGLSWWEKLLANIRGEKQANPNLCLLQNWKHALSETRLFPGERTYFETSPEKTTQTVTDLTVSF